MKYLIFSIMQLLIIGPLIGYVWFDFMFQTHIALLNSLVFSFCATITFLWLIDCVKG